MMIESTVEGKKTSVILLFQSAISGNVNNSRMIAPFCVRLLLY